MIDIFTNQLNDSNPVLTSISDAMTEEARCLEQLETPGLSEDEKKLIREKISHWNSLKNEGQNKLMSVSNAYRVKMAEVRNSSS